MQRRSFVGGVIAASLLRAVPSSAQGDPLPSWNDGPDKQSIVDFVTRVTTRRRTATSCRCPSASPPSTMTARCGPSSRCTSRSIFAMDRVKAHGGAASRVAHDSSRSSSVLADDRAAARR